MNDQELNEHLSIIGYSAKWLEYGLLTQDLLSNQIHTFQNTEDKSSEHYRYTAFRNYLAAKDSLTDKEFANYSELALSDQDRVMGGAALIDLFTKNCLSDNQFDKLIAHMKDLGEWTKNTAIRQTFLRKLKQEQLTDELFGECLEQGDAVVQEYLLGIANHEQISALAITGRTRKIRTMAAHYLNR